MCRSTSWQRSLYSEPFASPRQRRAHPAFCCRCLYPIYRGRLRPPKQGAVRLPPVTKLRSCVPKWKSNKHWSLLRNNRAAAGLPKACSRTRQSVRSNPVRLSAPGPRRCSSAVGPADRGIDVYCAYCGISGEHARQLTVRASPPVWTRRSGAAGLCELPFTYYCRAAELRGCIRNGAALPCRPSLLRSAAGLPDIMDRSSSNRQCGCGCGGLDATIRHRPASGHNKARHPHDRRSKFFACGQSHCNRFTPQTHKRPHRLAVTGAAQGKRSSASKLTKMVLIGYGPNDRTRAHATHPPRCPDPSAAPLRATDTRRAGLLSTRAAATARAESPSVFAV